MTSSSQIQYKSGNPGYLDGYPVLVGIAADTVNGDGVMQVFENGFEIRGADQYGFCYNSIPYDTLLNYGDPVVSFGEDLIHGCSVTLNYA